MTPQRWARLKDLFEAALEREGSEREAYVARVCSNDPELRRELESLLEQQGHAGESIETATFEATRHTFFPGQLVANRFMIVSFIGRGGMGEVYEAEDQD